MSTSRYKVSAPGTVYHLYNRGNHKQKIFETEEDYGMYRGLVRKYCKANNFSVISFCFMPNHIHLLVRQNGDFSPAKLMCRLHTSYVMYFNKKYKKVGHLFQDRYKQKIVNSDEYILTLSCYIHMYPVKDKLVDRPSRYRWSSYSQFRGEGGRGICDMDTAESLGLRTVLTTDELTRIANRVERSETFESAIDS